MTEQLNNNNNIIYRFVYPHPEAELIQLACSMKPQKGYFLRLEGRSIISAGVAPQFAAKLVQQKGKTMDMRVGL